MKRCKKCGVLRQFDEFYGAAGARDGLRGECKACTSADKRRRYLADPQAAIERVKRWQQANPERVNAAQRLRRTRPEVKRRERAGHLMRKFGITVEQYDAMLEAQGGGCFICGRPPRPDISLHVDHDHFTGRVRGILCFCCNNALADFQDDPRLLRKAAAYLTPPVDPEEVELARERAFSLVGAGRRGGGL
jgi:hypothetical protein